MIETYQVGDTTVTRIPEMVLPGFTPGMLFPEVDPGALAQAIARQPPAAVSPDGQHLPLNIHSWLVRDKGRTVLIDTGAGNDKDRPHAPYFHRLQTPYLDRLKAAGIAPEDIDHVLLTHLHVDHVGWNTRLADGHWIPTFSKARYVFSRAEYAYFTDPAHHDERNRTSVLVQRDSVAPIVEAGLADMIEVDGSEAIDGFTFHSAPGHTLNHAAITLRSGGETAIFGGDVMHHPVQVAHPEWNSVFDAFGEEARASRLWALRTAAERQALVFTAHFPASAVGRVGTVGTGFDWTFL